MAIIIARGDGDDVQLDDVDDVENDGGDLDGEGRLGTLNPLVLTDDNDCNVEGLMKILTDIHSKAFLLIPAELIRRYKPFTQICSCSRDIINIDLCSQVANTPDWYQEVPTPVVTSLL